MTIVRQCYYNYTSIIQYILNLTSKSKLMYLFDYNLFSKILYEIRIDTVIVQKVLVKNLNFSIKFHVI